MRGADLVYARSKRLASRSIRLVDGGDFSHVAVVVDEDGTVVEATRYGVVISNVYTSESWRGVEWVCYSPALSDEDRADVVAQALWIAGEGWSYDWATFFGMGLFWATGGRLMVSGGAKASICSALAADCLHAGGERFPEAIPHFFTPRMLQRHYGVEAPVRV